MALSHSPRIPADNLIWYLDAANPRCYTGTGATASNLNTTGTSHNAIWGGAGGVCFLSEGGGCFRFIGSNFLSSGDVLDNTTSDISISCWANFDQNNGANNTILTKLGANGNFRMQLNGTNSLTYQIISSGNTLEGNNIYSVPPVVSPSPIGNWNMYTVTHSFSSRQVTLYVNGILYGGPFTFVNDRGDTPGPLTMGYSEANAQYAFLKLAIAMIYNKVLSSDEVKQLYDSMKGRFGL